MDKTKVLQDRLRAKVTVADNGCWIWNGSQDSAGYGKCFVEGVSMGAHRAAYLAWKGPIPKGTHVAHSCDMKTCINPDHLDAKLPWENSKDWVERHSQHQRKAPVDAKYKPPRSPSGDVAVPTLMRLRKSTRELLDRAAEDQRRTLVSIVEEAIRTHLKPRYGELDARLQQLLGGK